MAEIAYEKMLKEDLIRLCYEKDEQIASLQAQVNEKDEQIASLQAQLQEYSTVKQELENMKTLVNTLFSKEEIKFRLNEKISILEEQKQNIKQRIKEIQNTINLTDSEKTKLVAGYNKQIAQIDDEITKLRIILDLYYSEGVKLHDCTYRKSGFGVC